MILKTILAVNETKKLKINEPFFLKPGVSLKTKLEIKLARKS